VHPSQSPIVKYTCTATVKSCPALSVGHAGFRHQWFRFSPPEVVVSATFKRLRCFYVFVPAVSFKGPFQPELVSKGRVGFHCAVPGVAGRRTFPGGGHASQGGGGAPLARNPRSLRPGVRHASACSGAAVMVNTCLCLLGCISGEQLPQPKAVGTITRTYPTYHARGVSEAGESPQMYGHTPHLRWPTRSL